MMADERPEVSAETEPREELDVRAEADEGAEAAPESDEGAEAAPESDEGAEAEPESDEGAEAAPEVEAEPPDPQEVAGFAEEFVQGLIAAMGLTAEVSSSVEEERAHVDVRGEDLGILIGRRGQGLDALQELARTAVQRRVQARVSLLVDVEGYRARRREQLMDYAREIAERAKERGTEIELEPMNSYERRIVHNAVSEVEGATSFSEGEEPNRKVIVRGE
jgi:spoIIIJ-associated protein